MERWRPVPGYEGIYEVSDHGPGDIVPSRRIATLGISSAPDRVEEVATVFQLRLTGHDVAKGLPIATQGIDSGTERYALLEVAGEVEAPARRLNTLIHICGSVQGAVADQLLLGGSGAGPAPVSPRAPRGSDPRARTALDRTETHGPQT